MPRYDAAALSARLRRTKVKRLSVAPNKRLNDATDKEKKIAAVKRRMGQFLRAGVVNERTKEKMRYAAIRWPEHFAKWALVQ